MTTAGSIVSPAGLAAGIWPRTAHLQPGGEVSVGGIPLGTLATRYGTPAYILDETDVRYRCRTYRDAFGGAEIAYAGKAFLCRAMASGSIRRASPWTSARRVSWRSRGR